MMMFSTSLVLDGLLWYHPLHCNGLLCRRLCAIRTFASNFQRVVGLRVTFLVKSVTMRESDTAYFINLCYVYWPKSKRERGQKLKREGLYARGKDLTLASLLLTPHAMPLHTEPCQRRLHFHLTCLLLIITWCHFELIWDHIDLFQIVLPICLSLLPHLLLQRQVRSWLWPPRSSCRMEPFNLDSPLERGIWEGKKLTRHC